MSTSMSTSHGAINHRNTIFCENAKILVHESHADNQFILRVHAPECAAHAQPGMFAHVTCGPSLPMRRPLSIMRVNPARGWAEFLYKVMGPGLATLAHRVEGESISVLGPIGQPFHVDHTKRKPLLIGGGVGIPPMIFLAEMLKGNPNYQPLLLMGSEIPFPFELCKSQSAIRGLANTINSNFKLLEDWQISGRLASLQNYQGCYQGYVTELADQWLKTLAPTELNDVQIFSCGPTVMLSAVADLAKKYDIRAQVSLEEHMACAVGGCAGCTVLIKTENGNAMKRVCVDGPVFAAHEAF